ncbi:MAG: glutathione S-transferase family protein [Pseudomonadota bacterium]
MITVFGRPDSSAVARVMWTIGELDVPHKRIDWGGAYGGNDDKDYRQMNPAGRIPAIRLEDGNSLWESNTIIRYLCAMYGGESLLPTDFRARANVEAWMDWSPAFANAISQLRKAYKPADATMERVEHVNVAIRPVLEILDTQLQDRAFILGDDFGCADIALGVWAHRLWRVPEDCRPKDLPALYGWIERLQQRPAYEIHVMEQVSAGPQRFQGG